MRTLWALDPGTTQTGFVQVDPRTWPPVVMAKGVFENEEMRCVLRAARILPGVELAIEMVQSFGMSVGKSTFETVRWIGRFQEVFENNNLPTHMVYRMEVKMALCNNSRAKDGNIRQAIMDMYPESGGGKRPVLGIKKQPGPLFGMADHMWPALGVAITHLQKEKNNGDHTQPAAH